MKRVVLTAPGRLEVQEAPVPRPGPGEALLRIRAVGVCGSDLHMFKEGAIGGISLTDAAGPFVPGHECMGVVQDAGPGTDRSLVGRRVFVEPAINCRQCRWCLAGKPNVCPHHSFLGTPPRNGCLAEYMVHPAWLCQPLPDDVSDDAAVLLEPLAIALHSLERVAATVGQSAVVLGAGPIGLAHVLLLARAGAAPLLATDVLDYRAECAARLGATAVANPRKTDVPALVADLTAGAGADMVFECAGVPETFGQMVRCAAPAGRVAVVGIPVKDELTFRHSAARRKGLDVLMIRRANLTFHRALGAARADGGRLLKALESLATHHWPMEQCQQAFEAAAEYRDGVLKAIINV